MGLGVLAHLLAGADEVAERDVHQASVQVDVCPLQAAQLTSPSARDGRESQVQGNEVQLLVSGGRDDVIGSPQCQGLAALGRVSRRPPPERPA
jgi:hypothetical protein